jgi:hypothetical protein
MDNKYTQSPRLAVINSVLSQKHLQKALTDAYDAPIGSTKRIYAKAILNSMKKLAPKQDGQGGAGIQAPTTLLPPAQPVAPTVKNVIPAPLPPAPISKGMTLDSSGRVVPIPTGPLVKKPEAPPASSMPQIRIQQGQDITKLTPNTSPTQKPKITLPQYSDPTSDQSAGLFSDASSRTSVTDLLPQAYKAPTAPVKGPFDIKKAPVLGEKTPEPAPVAGPQKQTSSLGNGILDSSGMSDKDILNKFHPPKTPDKAPETTEKTEQPYVSDGTLQGDLKQIDPDLIGGPAYFINKKMKDAGYGSQQDWLLKKDEELKEKLGMNLAQDRMERLKGMDSTFETRAKEWVAGKDEAIKAIDAQMLALQKSVPDNVSLDPATKGIYDAQMDYLTIMKGKQQGRYDQYVAQAKAEFKSDLDNATTAYEKLKARYDLQMASANADWKDYHDSLLQDFTFLSGMPQAAANYNSARINQVTEGIKQQEALNALKGSTNSDDAYMAWLGDSKKISAFTQKLGDPKTPDAFSRDPEGVRTALETSGVDAAYMAKHYVESVNGAIDTYLDPSKSQLSKLEIGNNANTILNDFSKVAESMMGSENPDVKNQGVVLKQLLVKKTPKTLTNYLDDQTSLVSALKSLIKFKSPNDMGDDKKSDFISKYAATINTTVLDNLWETHKQNATGIAQEGGEKFYAPKTGNLGKESLDSLKATVLDVISPLYEKST